ncbi:phosphoribosyltransferase family protein [Treponema sp.]|uniref:ComF family protein n=1 Tax=Treponema sp. TaxID=166 RepID=UPI003FA270F3
MNYHIPAIFTRNMARQYYSRLICPQLCLLCGKPDRYGLPVCRHCIDTVFMPYINADYSEDIEKIQRCMYCGKILISEREYCTRCRQALEGSMANGKSGAAPQQPACTRIYSLFPYIGLGQKLVPLWKNNAIRTFAPVFASIIWQFLTANPQLTQLPLVPVPPRPQKLREKGWDQVEDIVRELSVYPQTRICRCLKRQDGTPQKKLSKTDRAGNLQGKIHAAVEQVPERVLLIDDVMTTGATLEACARVLKNAGCKEIVALCLFFD